MCILRFLLCLGLCLLLPDQNAFSAPEVFKSSTHQLKFTIPSSFEQKAVKSPAVIVLLRPRTGDFPTFNVTVTPGRAPLNRPLAKEIATILTEYHRAGFKTAQAKGMEFLPIKGHRALHAEINYQRDGQPFTAVIHVIPLADKRFYFTFIDSAKNLEQHRPLLTSILDSLELSAPTATVQKTAPKQHKNNRQQFSSLSLFFLIAAIAAVVWILHRRAKKADS